jgi:type IV pilus assembly protein PilX
VGDRAVIDARRHPNLARRDQAGVVLWVALIVLLVMTLAGVALLRQMGAGVSIAGNVAFKESATSVADRGVEEARAWYLANAAILQNDLASQGYYSSWGASTDPETFDWSAAGSREVTADAASTGNSVRYVIHRLCATPNLAPNDPAQRCSDSTANNAGASKGGAAYGSTPFTPAASPFYRVTTRVVGPRNTLSYTQVVMN